MPKKYVVQIDWLWQDANRGLQALTRTAETLDATFKKVANQGTTAFKSMQQQASQAFGTISREADQTAQAVKRSFDGAAVSLDRLKASAAGASGAVSPLSGQVINFSKASTTAASSASAFAGKVINATQATKAATSTAAMLSPQIINVSKATNTAGGGFAALTPKIINATQANRGLLDGMGATVVGFAALHLAIRTGTDLWNKHIAAMKEARQEQDRALGTFVDERRSLKGLARVQGVPNDAALRKQVSDVQVATGWDFQESRDFLQKGFESGAAFVGRSEEDFTQRGAKFTPEQMALVNKQTARFAAARGLDSDSVGMFMGNIVKSKDVHKMTTEAGAAEIMKQIVTPAMILDRGQGDTNVLLSQMAMFHSEFGNQFADPTEEAMFLRQVAGARPGGDVHTAGRAFAMELLNPPERAMKPGALLHGVKFDDNAKLPDRVRQLRKVLDARAKTDQERQALILKTFTVRQGMAASGQLLDSGAEAREAKILSEATGPASAAKINAETDTIMKADMMRRDINVQRGLVAQSELQARFSGLDLELTETERRLRASGQIGPAGKPTDPALIRELYWKEFGSFGAADTSLAAVVRYKTQERMLKDIQAVRPGFRVARPELRAGDLKAAERQHLPYGYQRFALDANEDVMRAQLLKLKQLHDDAMRTPAGGRVPGQAMVRPAGGRGRAGGAGGGFGGGGPDLGASMDRLASALDQNTRATLMDSSTIGAGGGAMAMRAPGMLPLGGVPGVGMRVT
jgi:hypothetical protein